VLVPCGHTLAAVCPSCAERKRTLRAAQCREGWHLDREPIVQADEPDDEQRMWVEMRASVQRHRDQSATAGEATAEDDEVIGELDEEITRSGMRGNVLPAKPTRRHRSTRRRQDTPDLPQRKVAPRTIGKTYAAPDGKTFRPSMFITLTCPSYGRVGEDGTQPTRPPTTISGRRGMRCTSPRCSTGSSRICGGSSVTTSSTRRRRTAAAARTAHPHRHARHSLKDRAAPGARRHLSPGLVATDSPGQARRRASAYLA
jgi:hypothetical protein